MDSFAQEPAILRSLQTLVLRHGLGLVLAEKVLHIIALGHESANGFKGDLRWSSSGFLFLGKMDAPGISQWST